MKYILYARKSSEDKNCQVLSLDSQVDTMKKLGSELKLNIVEVLRESKSAKKPYNRPLFESMMKMVKRGEVDGIVCWKLDRLSRNPIDSGQIQWFLQEGIIKEIQTIEKRYLPEDNALIFNVESGMANQYIRDLSRNVKRGMQTKLEKGYWPNYAPIGYFNKDGKVFPDKDKAKYVAEAFELYAKGSYSVKAIADILYQEGFRSRSGYKYHKSKIYKILFNPFYYGVMRMHGKFYAGKHKPVISKELFDNVQLALQGKSHSKKQKHFFALRGFFRCHKCGCLLTATLKKGFTYYYCTNGKGNCNEHRKYLRSEELGRKMAKEFAGLRFNPELVEIMYLSAKEKTEHKKTYLVNAKNSLVRELESVKEKSERLLEGFVSGFLKKDRYESKSKELEKREADLNVQIKKIEQKLHKSVSTLEQQKKIFLDASEAEKEFSEAKGKKKRSILENLLWNATVENQEIASVSYKQPYQILANIENKDDFKQMRASRVKYPEYSNIIGLFWGFENPSILGS